MRRKENCVNEERVKKNGYVYDGMANIGSILRENTRYRTLQTPMPRHHKVTWHRDLLRPTKVSMDDTGVLT